MSYLNVLKIACECIRRRHSCLGGINPLAFKAKVA